MQRRESKCLVDSLSVSLAVELRVGQVHVEGHIGRGCLLDGKTIAQVIKGEDAENSLECLEDHFFLVAADCILSRKLIVEYLVH